MIKEQRYVVIVEDDLSVLYSVRLQMREILPSHYRIETANDGAEALELLSDISADKAVVPVIITDHQMPRMTGSEFLIRASELMPQCRNIMLTGEAGLADITELINKQALFRYLSKPWSQTDLEMTVLSALESFNQEYKLEKLNRDLAEMNTSLQEMVDQRTFQLNQKTRRLQNGLDFGQLMQKNLLPRTEDFERCFRSVEILFQPHTAVSGDFYTTKVDCETHNYIVIGDATGHGIAGAFLSTICLGYVKEHLKKVHTTPLDILTATLQDIRTLGEFSSDTMKQMISVELTVVCIDYEANEILYASNSKQLIFFKNDCLVEPEISEKFACCTGEPDARENLKHRGVMGRINLNEVDCLLLHTDGVKDQFLESTNKKMGLKRLINDVPKMKEQGVSEWFRKLKGNQEQTDDATLLLIDL